MIKHPSFLDTSNHQVAKVEGLEQKPTMYIWCIYLQKKPRSSMVGRSFRFSFSIIVSHSKASLCVFNYVTIDWTFGPNKFKITKIYAYMLGSKYKLVNHQLTRKAKMWSIKDSKWNRSVRVVDKQMAKWKKPQLMENHFCMLKISCGKIAKAMNMISDNSRRKKVHAHDVIFTI